MRPGALLPHALRIANFGRTSCLTKCRHGGRSTLRPRASAHAHELLDRQTVELELDLSQGDRDIYGRLLAYAWLPGRKNGFRCAIRSIFTRARLRPRCERVPAADIAVVSLTLPPVEREPGPGQRTACPPV